jgi:hypothetical protein
MPILAYSFGGRERGRYGKWSLRLGLGLGGGWLLSDGDVIINDQGAVSRQTFSFNSPVIAAAALAELRRGSYHKKGWRHR